MQKDRSVGRWREEGGSERLVSSELAELCRRRRDPKADGQG
jgi:hypothetical protein